MEAHLWAIFAYSAYCLFIDFAVQFIGIPSSIGRYINTSITVVEYSCFAVFIYLCVKKQLVRRIVALSVAGFVAFMVLYMMYQNRHARLDSIPIGIETLLVLIFSLYLLFEIMNTVKDTFINYNYRFWVATGMMIYLAGSFFIYIYANELATGQGNLLDIPLGFFYILKNIFFAIAIIMCYRQPKPKLPPSSIPYLDLDAR